MAEGLDRIAEAAELAKRSVAAAAVEMAKIKAAADAAGVAVKDVSGAMAKLDAAAASAQKKTDADLKKLEEAAKRTKEESERTADKAKDLFNRGIGGGQLAEQLKHVREGFRLAKDGSEQTSTRFMAAAGIIGIVTREAIALASALNSVSLAAQAEREQIALLGGMHQNLQDATSGTITLTQESALREQVLAHHLTLSAQQYEVLARAAREYAAVHGVDMAAGITHVVGEMTREETAAGGVATAAVRAEEAINRMAQAQAGHAPLVRSAAEEQARLDGAYGRAAATIVNRLMPGTDAMLNQFRSWAAQAATVQTATTRVTDAAEAQRLAQLHEAQASEAALEAARALREEHQRLKEGLDHTKTSAELLASAMRANAGTFARGAERIAAANLAVTEGRARRAEDRRVRAVITASYTGTDRTDALGGAGLQAGGGDNGIAALRAQIARERAIAEEIGAGTVDVSRRTDFDRRGRAHLESMRGYLERELEALRTHNQAMIAENASAAQQEQSDNQEQNAAYQSQRAERFNAERLERVQRLHDLQEHAIAVHAAMQAEIAARRDANDFALQASQQWRANLQLDITSAQRFASFTTSAYNAVTAAAEQQITALIEGTVQGDEALRAFTHTIALQIGFQAAKEALFEFAAAAAMMGRAAGSYGADAGAEVSAGWHIAAGLGYAALAGGGIALAVATNPQRPAQASTGLGAGGPASAASASAGSAGGTTINYTFEIAGSYIDRDGFRDMTMDSIQTAHRLGETPMAVREREAA